MIRVPDRFHPLRPVQTEAAEQIAAAWANGTRVVIWQAPVGSGKTVGAVAAAEHAKVDRLLYTCSGRQLQDQFARDFPAAVLKGRSNYPTQMYGPNGMPKMVSGRWKPGYSCADCNKTGRGDDAVCSYCNDPSSCAYTVAKQTAIRAPMACINMTYLLTEANGPGGFSGWECAVIDEADVLEAELMRYLEFRVGKRTAAALGLTLPKKGVHRSTMVEWLLDCAGVAARRAAAIKIDRRDGAEQMARDAREKQKMLRLAGKAAVMARSYDEDWTRVYEDYGDRANDLVIKPVVVDQYGQEMIWRHADRWLVMSGTIISPEQYARDLGLERHEWTFIDSPSTFPKEHRPVVICGMANMTKKEMDHGDAIEKMGQAVQAVVDRHEGENVLVHAHTYRLADEMVRRTKPADGRNVYRYGSAADREATVERFRRDGGVLVAPSLARGVDLPDDLCRVVVVVKAPFPYLGDPQIQKRMHRRDKNGEVWYAMQVAREVMQMTGRGVRHEEDWAVCYILDGQFVSNIWRNRKGMFPEWWRDAVVLATQRQVLSGAVGLELPTDI